MNPGELIAALGRLTYLCALGRNPTAAEWAAFRSAVSPDGSNLDTVVGGIVTSPEAVAYQHLMGALLGAVRSQLLAQAALAAALSG